MSRITRGPDIRMIFERGKRLSRGPLTLIGLRRADTPEARRAGVIVGRKFGGAVARNRIKRRVRELLRTHPESVPPGWDWLLLPRSPVQSWSFITLNQRITALFVEWTRTQA